MVVIVVSPQRSHFVVIGCERCSGFQTQVVETLVLAQGHLVEWGSLRLGDLGLG